MKISYLPHENIDKLKWDRCIDNAANGLIYACSFYLDAMSSNWDALVLNEYEAVMPLVWKRKYGFYYLYQPFFIGSLGIFGNISDETINLFLNAIPKHFKYADIDFKEDIINLQKIILKDGQLKKRNNHLLNLDKGYEEIYKDYKRLAARMLKRAATNEVEILRDCQPEEVIDFYEKNYKQEHKNIKAADYKRLLDATKAALAKGKAATYLAKKDGKPVACYIVLKDERFIYSLVGGSNQQGKNFGAFYLLTDAAIKDHAATNRIFRFEGSDKKGIAFFNSQFNPIQVCYYHLKLNRLPWPIKLLK